jgi:hypothetical protein
MLAAVLVPLSLPPPPQLFDLSSQFIYLVFHAATPQLFDLPSQFVYLLPLLFYQAATVQLFDLLPVLFVLADKIKARRHLRCLWRFLRRLLPHHLLPPVFSYACPHNALLFRRTVKIRVQIASSFGLGLLLLHLERIGCSPPVLARSRHLPTDPHPPFAPRYLEAVILVNLLGNVQVWRSLANGGELVANIFI